MHPPISTTIPPLLEHRCGHPKGSVKIKPGTYGPHPRLRWPPRTGYKQRLRALLGEDAAWVAKRPGGWPQKQDSSPVSVEFGKVVGLWNQYYFPLLIYSKLVSGTPSQCVSPSFQAPSALLCGPGSSVPSTPSPLSDTAVSLSSHSAAATSRTVIQPPDTFLSTSAPGLCLLEACCTIIPDEDSQQDVRHLIMMWRTVMGWRRS